MTYLLRALGSVSAMVCSFARRGFAFAMICRAIAIDALPEEGDISGLHVRTEPGVIT